MHSISDLRREADLTSPSADEFRVALVVPRHGPAGIFGLECITAAEIAAAEIDADGGVCGRSISFVDVDAGGDPDHVARHIANLLDSGQIHAVTGWHLSNLRQSIARVLRGRAPYVYAAAYEGGEDGDGVLCSGEVPGDQILAALDWLRTELRLRRWYIIGNDYIWPRESAARTIEGVRHRDVEVVRQRFVPLGTEDPLVWNAILADIQHSNVDGVITLLVGSDAVRFNRAFAAADLSSTVVRFSPFIDETVVLATGPDATENLFVSAGYFSSLVSASALEFQRDFALAWDLMWGSTPAGGSPAPGTMAESTYSGVHLLASIAGTSIPSVQDTRRAFEQWAWETPHGTVELHSGAAAHPVHLAVARGIDLDVVDQISTGGAR